MCSALSWDQCKFYSCLHGRGREDHFEEAGGTRIDGKSNDMAVKWSPKWGFTQMLENWPTPTAAQNRVKKNKQNWPLKIFPSRSSNSGVSLATIHCRLTFCTEALRTFFFLNEYTLQSEFITQFCGIFDSPNICFWFWHFQKNQSRAFCRVWMIYFKTFFSM